MTTTNHGSCVPAPPAATTAPAAPLDLDALESEATDALARSNPRNHDAIRIAVRPNAILALVAAARRGEP